jgi:hypothetical protein
MVESANRIWGESWRAAAFPKAVKLSFTCINPSHPL